MTEPSTFNELIAAGLLAYSLLFALLSLIPALRLQGLRLFAVLTVAGLAVLSDHWATYLIAVVVVAATVMDLESLRGLGAALRGERRVFGYRARTLTEEELRQARKTGARQSPDASRSVTADSAPQLEIELAAISYLERELFCQPLQRHLELSREGVAVRLDGLFERRDSEVDTAVEVRVFDPEIEGETFPLLAPQRLAEKAELYQEITGRQLEVVLALVIPDLDALDSGTLEKVQRALASAKPSHKLLWLTRAQIGVED